MDKREKEIKFRVTSDEYSKILERKTTPRLATWLRNLALDQEPKNRKVNKADPDLLFALAKIGSNINQIARACNTEKITRFESAKILLELQKIELLLNEIVKNDS